MSYLQLFCSLEEDIFQYAKHNLAVVNVYIKDPVVTRILRDQKIPVIAFVANTGGLLGLCMGFSLVSVFEIVYHMIGAVRKWWSSKLSTAPLAPTSGLEGELLPDVGLVENSRLNSNGGQPLRGQQNGTTASIDHQSAQQGGWVILAKKGFVRIPNSPSTLMVPCVLCVSHKKNLSPFARTMEVLCLINTKKKENGFL